MRNYKSLILAGLLAFGFSSCNTDDLEKDIDNLANRVADFEAQVLKLNDEMNIIRVLMDGNKTITKYTVEGEKYVLTLSNGETIVLTQGNDGGNYPTIEIGANGNWFIDGNDTGERAEAENGENTQVTPEFKIENGTWWVSYDGGQTYEDLGKSATGTSVGTSPIGDFKVSDDGSEFIFTIGEKTYTIPVVKGLICQIVGEKDYYYISDEQTFNVKVNLKSGDLVRAVVPSEWKAVVSDYSTLEGEQEITVTVTPPATVSKCALSVEVTRGINTAADEVTLKTAVKDYYQEYMAGFDIQVGNTILQKTDNGCIINGSQISLPVFHVSENTSISEDGIYFINPDLEVNYNIIGGATKILIGNNPTKKSALSLDKSITLGAEQSSLYCKNLNITLNNSESTTRILTVNNPQNYVSFEGCGFNVLQTKNPQFSYMNGEKQTIKNILIKDCIFKVDINYTLFGFGVNVYNETNLTLINNIFYSSDDANVTSFKLFTVNNDNDDGGVNQFVLQNNTFYNVHALTSGMVNGNIKEMYILSNLFECSKLQTSNLLLLRYRSNSTNNKYEDIIGEIKSNYGFINTEGSNSWQIQYGGTSPLGTEGIIKETEGFFIDENPASNCNFKVKDKFEGLGANL